MYSRPVLKDHSIGHKNVVSRQVVFGDRFNFIEMQDLLPVPVIYSV